MQAELREVLAEAQYRGFIGGTDLDAHLHHAEAFVRVVERLGRLERGLDLGSGGGLPGLVLAGDLVDTRWWLIDAAQRRAEFLVDAVARLGWEDRVTVAWGRAEDLARAPDLRGQIDVVTARAFAPPAVTAECAAGFLCPGGHLVVSEPPLGPEGEAIGTRWPVDGLAALGLEPVLVTSTASGVSPGPQFKVLRQARICPDRFPRRVGVPSKRPLFGTSSPSVTG